MIFLHKSVFQSHGYLSSANCHVDSRWVLKVSGFALHAFENKDYRQQVSRRFLPLFQLIHLHISIMHLQSQLLPISHINTYTNNNNKSTEIAHTSVKAEPWPISYYSSDGLLIYYGMDYL